MGTNIYLRKVSSKDDLDSFKAKLKANADAAVDFGELRDVLEAMRDEIVSLEEEIHICKISGGWQLLFQANWHLYDCTWQAMTDCIRKAIESREYVMKDEYGKDFSLNDLEEALEFHKDGFTCETYKKYRGDYEEFLPWNVSLEFISDGLRWTEAVFS